MNEQTRLEALSAFLRSQRAKLQPEAVGLIPGGRRRTPGLRREEVAQLAGVSSTWYTWLEQGRDIKVSASVLDAISRALQLNSDERKYLFALATEHAAEPAPMESGAAELSPSLKKILKELAFCPTIISDRRCNIVGWNDAASFVFLDFNQVPSEHRNMIRLLFTRKELRALAVNWEHFVRGFLSIFRSYYGQYVGDEWYGKFIEEMRGLNPEFEPLWNESRVSSAPEVLIEFRHAKAGKMLFHLTSLQVQGETDARCSIYTPVEGSRTEEKLKRSMQKQPASPMR
ncbi:helix-turn-helix transcriptional regulator [Paenibacillus thermotolerans]|uniref:helix-turn-helix transcriptional regulator n=1 Tax=Paenibacillus thermotolerans TaxID=3027807 RepID=UPI0023678CA0|nr:MULTISPECIES: helix-turn-helix transcriptional regulator [unclassified Paenibacillus]